MICVRTGLQGSIYLVFGASFRKVKKKNCFTGVRTKGGYTVNLLTVSDTEAIRKTISVTVFFLN